MKKTTLADIAAACGVSKAAVSYVLNGRNGAFAVSESVSRAVLEECARTGYHPDAAALALARLKTAPLRLLYLSPWLYAQFSDFSARVHQVFSLYDNLSVTFQSYPQGSLRLTPAMLKRADAVLIAGTLPIDDAYLLKHRADFAKVVLLNRSVPGYPCACADDHDASCRLGEHFRDRYVRRVAVVRPTGLSMLEQTRVDGFLTASLGDVSPTPVTEPGTLNFFPQYYDAARFLREAAYLVPHTVGAAAFDCHALLSAFVTPPLTVVDPHIGDMTRRALDAAREIKENRTPDVPVTHCEIVFNESTNFSEGFL